jgi:hypothetical protein
MYGGQAQGRCILEISHADVRYLPTSSKIIFPERDVRMGTVDNWSTNQRFRKGLKHVNTYSFHQKNIPIRSQKRGRPANILAVYIPQIDPRVSHICILLGEIYGTSSDGDHWWCGI